MDGTEVRVLGPLEVRTAEGLRPIGGRRAQRVLGALVARSASFSSSEVLIDDVWGGSPPQSARNSLQTYISRLRAVVEPLRIRREGLAYRLVVGPGGLDALAFEELCRLARQASARRRWSEALRGYEQALGLWRGAAFADLRDVAAAAGWATRLDEERLRAREGALRARSELGDDAEIVGELEDLATFHPWREPLWALWATVLYRQGRQVEALGVLRRLRRRLADELGLQPGAEIEELEVAILRHDPVLDRSAEEAASGPASGGRVERDLPPDLAALRGRRMIGRDAALARAEECWERARSGSCTSMFVAGEAGIGKSRLAAELAQRVVDGGGHVLYGRATERIDLAYQPFAHALRDVAAHHLAALGDRATDLAPLVHTLPALPALPAGSALPVRPGDDDPGLIGPDDRRFRLLEAVARLLGQVADPGGLLVVLDDLHCTTGATLGLLEHVLTVSRPARVMVLGTVRDTDLVQGGEVDRFLADIPSRTRERELVVRLEGLGAAAVAGVLRDHGEDAPPREVDRVRDLTAGNPLLITELLHTTGGGQSLVEFGGPAGTDRVGVPASVARLILARVRRLGDGGEVLAWASLIGTDFEFEVLRLVMDAPDVLERLEEASRAGLVRELDAGRWQFRHALTAEALRDRTGATRLATRHETIADALEVALPADVVLGRIAHHRCAAARLGRVGPAVDAALRAARLRLAQLAPAEALLHVREGIAALGNGDPSMAAPEIAAAEAELQLAAAAAHQQLFAEQDRIAAADAALAAARRAGSHELVGRAAVARAAFWTQGRLDAVAVAALDEALAALDRPGAPGAPGDTADLRSQLLANLAGSLAVSAGVARPGGPGPGRSPEELVGLADEAVRLAQYGDNATTRLLADSSLAVTLYGGPWAARQLEVADRIAHRGGDLDAVYGARWSAAARLALGDRPGFTRDTDVLCREGARHGLRALHAYGLQCTALLALLDARFDGAEAAANEAVAVGRGHENFTRIRLAQQFWIAAEKGQLTAIEPAARAVAAESGLPIFVAMLGLVLSSTGATAEAARLVDDLAVDGFRCIPRDILWLATVAACAEIVAATGSEAHAPPLAHLLAPYAGQLVVVAGSAFVYGAVDRFRAMLAALQDDREAAIRGFDAAVELERRVGAVPLEVRSRWWRLRLLGDEAGDEAGDDPRDLADLARRHDLGWLAGAPPAAGAGA